MIETKDWELVKKSCEDQIKRAELDKIMATVGLEEANKQINSKDAA